MSKILSIKQVPSEQYVYDPACTAPHAYISNGFISHNCNLWIDEIEKALSGTKSSNYSDGGTLARVFGTLLTAMEEELRGVTIIATANDITQLPPELIRRFDEVFFCDLPVESEREEIFIIHLTKRKRDPGKYDLKRLAKASDNYTGAEIEKAIREAIANAYAEDSRDITNEDMLEAIHNTKPISTVTGEKINAIRGWAKDRARYASQLAADAAGKHEVKGKNGKTYSMDDLNKDMTKTSKAKDELSGKSRASKINAEE